MLARLRAALPWGDAQAAQTARRAITQTRFVVVDVETSGLNLRSDRLLSIGAVIVDAGAIRPADSIELVLRQTRESGHDNILLHGIAGGQQRAGLHAAEALRLFSAFAGADPLVAYHADFDRRFLEGTMREALGARARWTWIDVAWLAPALLDRVGVHRPLDDWCAAYGIAHVARHNAASDALKLGVEHAVRSAIRGHGGMPPRGDRADLTDAEIRNAILYMYNPSAAPKEKSAPVGK